MGACIGNVCHSIWPDNHLGWHHHGVPMSTLADSIFRIGDSDSDRCLCCLRDEDHCVCPSCAMCGQRGNFQCYIKHGLQGTHEQAVSRQRWLVCSIETRLLEEKECLEEIKSDETIRYKGE